MERGRGGGEREVTVKEKVQETRTKGGTREANTRSFLLSLRAKEQQLSGVMRKAGEFLNRKKSQHTSKAVKT